MKKFLQTATIITLSSVLFLAPASAAEPSNEELHQRITQLEQRLAAGQVPGDTVAVADWLERITLSGLLEVEANYAARDYQAGAANRHEESSDVTVASVELGIDAQLTEQVSGHVLLLWEEDDSDGVDVDEAFILIDGGEQLPVALRGGKMYVPFGNFSSNMVSDPLTLELGETRESAIELGLRRAGIYAALYAFNGDIDEARQNNNHIDNYGVSIGYGRESETLTVDIGCSYINNLLESDGWGDYYEERVAVEGLELGDYVDGLAAHAVLEVGAVMLIGEYVGAMQDIDYQLGADKIKEDAIAAWNVELAYSFGLFGKESSVAVGYQGSDNGADFLPETRWLGTLSCEIYNATTLAVEILQDRYDNAAELDEAQSVTAQLAIVF